MVPDKTGAGLCRATPERLRRLSLFRCRRPLGRLPARREQRQRRRSRSVHPSSRRQRLDEQDLAARRCRTVEPRHHNRDQEEEEEGEALIATAHQTIDQAGCQKAVIEPLICGQNPGLRRKIGRGAEGLPTARRVPEEHLQDENIGMDGRDQRGKDLGNHAGLRGVDAAWDSPVGCLS